MKKLALIILVVLLGFNFNVKADEGMWIPFLAEELVYMQMKNMGLELTPEDIYSVNQSSLKDAIVIFGRGCTGEIVSPEGLLLTNHHCGYGSIQSVSTPDKNLLTDGFWAMTKEEEIPIEGLTVQFLISITPSTSEVLNGVTSNMSEAERDSIIGINIGNLVTEATKGTHYRALIRPFYEGNEYYTFVYEVFRDIRFVGAPPEAIGKFGADTDNWMWPRHTGDFSLFRVYTAPDGTPASYAEDNVPLKPKHFLPISISGYKEGDFSMILGYPGSTNRYLTSYGVKLAIEESNPTIVKIREKKLGIMKEEMDKDPAVRLQYASKYSRTSNYWKYYIGQTKGLKRLKVYDKKLALENEFETWVDDDPSRETKYGKALHDIANAYSKIELYNLSARYFREAVQRGPEILSFANRYRNLLNELKLKPADNNKISRMTRQLKDNAQGYFKNYNATIDRNLLASMLQMYYENVPQDQRPVILNKIATKYKGDFVAYAEDVFEKSIFTSQQKVDAFLENPKAKTLEKDPAYQTIRSFYEKNNELQEKRNEANALLDKGRRLFIAGLREMQSDKDLYPDANFTMRLTYGIVDDYYPADAVHYNYYTTMDGIMDKEDPSTWEFVVPEKLKELYLNKDYGPYGEDGVMKVCFLTNHDITGGNSGSPVINGKGQLVGVAFDGNWEAMSGDIAFEPELQRTINVDIRYVLFIIDKFAGAKNLIDEMKIVYKQPEIIIGPPEKETAPAEELIVQ